MKTFEEFWPFYVAQHSDPTCRKLHFIGTSFGLLCALPAVLVSPWFVAVGLIGAYGMAWAGHYFFEKNRPATFSYPLWSFRADFKMYVLMLRGRF